MKKILLIKKIRVPALLVIILSFAMMFARAAVARQIDPADARPWFKADLHTHHTYNEPLKDTINRYRETGYNFLALSTKDASQPLDWEKYSDDRMLVVAGVEQSFLTSKGQLGHVLAFRIKTPYRETSKWTLKEGYAKLRGKNKNVLLGINHPHDGRWSIDDVMEAAAEGVVLFELNSIDMKHGEFETALWDAALTRGARLYATLVNDVHHHDDIDAYGFVMIRAEELSLKNMIMSLESGDFYAMESGCAAKPEKYVLTETAGGGKTLEISAPGASEIRIISDNGKVAATYPGDTATHPVTGAATYLRAEIIDPAGRYIFLQPIFLIP